MAAQRLTEGNDDWSGFLAFDDYVLGLGGADRMNGAGGNDRLYGGAGSDTIRGGDGDDILDGGDDLQLVSVDSDTSSDHLLGEAGNDTLRGKAGDDVLDGGSGADNLYGGEGRDTLFSTSLGGPTFTIDAASDAARSDAGGIMDGGGGNDTIVTSHDFSGTMTIIGGTGTDTLAFARDKNFFRNPTSNTNTVDLLTQSGTTVFNSTLVVREIENIDGDDYNDVFRGDHGANVLRGFGGNDRLQGRGGADTLDGGSGTDVADYSGSLAVDVDLTRATQLGNHAQGDVLISIEDVDGSAFADKLRGNGAANYLFGSGGNDRLEGRGGADTLNGGSGIDTASYESSTGGVYVVLDDPTLGSASYAAFGDAAGDTLISIENLVGSAHTDVLGGNSADNRIEGGGGNDEISGHGGADTIDGGFGNDTLWGGQGVDTVSFESWDPTGLFTQFGEAIRIDLGQGSATRTFTNPTTGVVSVAETDTLSGFENVRGSNRAETIVGNSGANVLEGRGGNDLLEGGGSSDTLDGGAGIDTATYESNAARVVVNLRDNADGSAEEHAQVGTRSFVLSTDTLRGIENVRGSAFNDDITGNSDNNRLSGEAGDDNIFGGSGNDTLIGGTGDDNMNGGNNSDTFYVDSARDTVVDSSAGTFETVYTNTSYTLTDGADIELFKTTNDAGFGSIDLTGNASSQEVRGNAGSNMLAGGLGTDILTGLGGEDAFIFNAALGASNIDTVTDYNVVQDQIRLDNAVFTNLSASEGNWLTAGEFTIGAAAGDTNDRIIYNSATGALLYDADGNGVGAAVQFATLATGLALTSDEFYIV